MSELSFIWDEFVADEILTPERMDDLWALGWRHFGARFFRYNLMIHQDALQSIIPLRIHLPEFVMSKSQRRIWRKNAILNCAFEPPRLCEETEELFHRHKRRFQDNIPDHLTDFLSTEPATKPCTCLQVRCSLEEKLVAASFMDVGRVSASSVYGLFEPELAARSLGIYTLLQEIHWATIQGLQFLYPGYTTRESSHYDYKKHFSALQGYDWESQQWKPVERVLQLS